MIKELHIAAQYLTAAAISYLDKKEDDSHTNLEWSNELHTLSSRPLHKEGDFLSLNFNTYSLEWNSGVSKKESLSLSAKTHLEILEWISNRINASAINKPYEYKFHYGLDYGTDMKTYSFPKPEKSELEKISLLFNVAQNSISTALTENNLSSEIKVWPHHFDMGAYAVVNDQLNLGMGLAIPDSAIADFYYYISGYNGENYVETKGLKSLSDGNWQTGDWKAATLKASGLQEATAAQFLNEAIHAYSK